MPTRMKKKKLNKIVFLGSFITIIVLIAFLVFYKEKHGLYSQLKINLNGKSVITLDVGSKYKEDGATATYGKKNISNALKISGNVKTNKIGNYKIDYTVKYKMLKKTVTRTIKVVDNIAPEIKLVDDISYVVIDNDYKEPGFTAIDNYDGNLTQKVVTKNNIDKNKIGQYEVSYTLEDSSKNKTTVKRKVNVVAKASNEQKIAVLNYHFFYDSSKGQVCNESICEEISQFKSQLQWLKDNNYKTLTMQEFKDWMYGEIELPEKSVLITIDDGAMGTGKHNGYTLIPALEEYKAHAVLFLITGWWDISNYQGSNYLEIQSHTHDMHNEGFCTGVTRGAKMLCQDYETVKADLSNSIAITGSKTAFCFPFYAYNEKALQAVKDVGFELAFVGGNRKAKRTDNKFLIPRYPITRDHTLEDFIRMVS